MIKFIVGLTCNYDPKGPKMYLIHSSEIICHSKNYIDVSSTVYTFLGSPNISDFRMDEKYVAM